MSLTRLQITMLLALIIAPSSSVGAGSPNHPKQAPQLQWTTHTDPAGFSVEIPVGWTLTCDQSSGRVEISSPVGHRVAIQPVYLQNTALQPNSAPAILSQIANQIWAEGQWGAPQVVSQQAARMQSMRQDCRASAFMVWMLNGSNTLGQVSAVYAPLAYAQGSTEVFDRIISSLRVTTPQGGQAGIGNAGLNFVPWRDPNEAAFTLQVPQGWNIAGGTVRPDLTTVQSYVEMNSPDGQVTAYLGDTFPMFCEPNEMYAMIGAMPGMLVPGATNTYIQPYMPGARFITDWVLPNRRGVGNYQIISANDRPDLSNQLNQSLGGMLPGSMYTAGEVNYRVMRNGQDCRGQIIAITLYMGSPAMPELGGMWFVVRLAMAEGPDNRYAEGEAAVLQAVNTLQVDPQWARMQQQTTQQQHEITMQTNREISDMMQSSWESQNASNDENQRRFTNYIRDTVDVVDPSTGQTLNIDQGWSSNYWSDGSGNIINSTFEPPGGGYTQLMNMDDM